MRLPTRILEDKTYLRACVRRAEVLEASPRALLLKTFAPRKRKSRVSSADSEMFSQAQLAGEGEIAEGLLRLDVCGDAAIRIRFSEGTDPGWRDAGLICGEIPEPGTCSWASGENTLTLITELMSLQVNLEPFSLHIRDRNGRTITRIGGDEKNGFNDWDAANTGIHDVPGGERLATETFRLAHDEAVYGFGETFVKLNKVGQTLDLLNTDGKGVTSPRTYKSVPFYLSTRGYGVFFHHTAPLTCWVGSLSACDVQVAVAENYLDYFVFTGSPKEVLNDYTALTGKSPVPPKWSFGFWQSKISYRSAAEALEVVGNLRKHQLPCDVFHFDTHWFRTDWLCDLEFDPDRFPDPAGFCKQMADLGVKISLWQLPYLPEGTALFEKIKAVDGFVKNRDGGIYDCGICFVAGFKGIVGVVDYTCPAAVRIHTEAIHALFRLGIRAIKTDFGEDAPLDGVYHDGTPGYLMRNRYPLLYNQAIARVTEAETGNPMVWARSAWAGGQRFPVHWGGDSTPNPENLPPQMDGGLSLGLSGFTFWSQDIGGFLGHTTDALLRRWIQVGVFLSHCRIHGLGTREIYAFDPETIRICKKYLDLRYRLLPYIYAEAFRCADAGLPMARALVLEFPDDPTVWNLSDQYLFGESLMLAPMYGEENHRKVYFPEGIWTDWWTGIHIQGPQWRTVEADEETLPLYLREGAIIPMGPPMLHVDEVKTETLEIRIGAFGRDGETRFDARVNDTVLPLHYTCKEGKHTLSAGTPDTGMQIIHAWTGDECKPLFQCSVPF
ncbi:MAG: alpha-xylosidase [Verrucomicrobia bacterium]|nr:alpha-xylosidase [Verrucomicrobiota bacterium]MCH8510016.1 alpha-xylosidase [Kiritimatiellia bacterium]